MRTCRAALVLGLSAFWFTVPTALKAATQASSRWRVVAVAPDVRAFVSRDTDGRVVRHDEGTMLTPDWRVAHVAADTVTLECTHPLAGQSLQIRLRAGDDIDLDAEAQRVSALRGVRQAPARIRVVPDKRPPAASRPVPKK